MTVVVTGGGTGLGKAIAATFVRGGEDVVITGRRERVLTEAAQEIGAQAHVCDNATVEGVSSLAERLQGEPISALVNNAGGNVELSEPSSGGLDGLRDVWVRNFEANVLTTVLTTRALADRIVDGGSVVTMGSLGAERGAESYGTAKAAVQSWTIQAAIELGARGITVNAVSPGFIDETEFFHGLLTEDRREQLVAATKNGRVGVPQDVAELVHFLASPGARHITAQTLHVNGGAAITR